MKPGLVTNGSITQTALALASMAKAGAIYCRLSRDKYHDPIDERVVRAFTKSNPFHTPSNNDSREIGTNSRVYATGRAKTWGDEEGCVCSEIVVTPSGAIYACGCKAKRFGTVFNPAIPDDWDRGECSREVARRAA